MLQRMNLLRATPAPVVVTQAVQAGPAVPMVGWVGCPPGEPCKDFLQLFSARSICMRSAPTSSTTQPCPATSATQ